MQNEYKIEENLKNQDFVYEDDNQAFLQSYFYEAVNNAINEISLIYSQDQEEKENSLQILVKIFKNILDYPENEKFFKLKTSNKLLQKIINFESVVDLLVLIGFKKSEINYQEYLELKDFDKQVFSTIYSFIMLLISGVDENSVYNCKEEKETIVKNNKMREFMLETAYMRNNSFATRDQKDNNEVNNLNKFISEDSSNKFKSFLEETAELRKNMISENFIQNTIVNKTSNLLKSMPTNFSCNSVNNFSSPWLKSNNSFNTKNSSNSNFESRVKYFSDLDFKNPDVERIRDPNFIVNDEIGKKSLELTNEFRKKNRMPTLKWNDKIWKICFEHSKNMGDQKVPFGHDGFNQRINKVGFYFSAAFENVFMCQGYSQYDLAKLAVEGWINSPGHRKNLLSGSTDCAIAVYKNSFGYYYLTQIFMRT